jgi:hypothetical protein
MNGPAWNHQRLEENGIGIHCVRQGNGSLLVLLHGWSGLTSLTVRFLIDNLQTSPALRHYPGLRVGSSRYILARLHYRPDTSMPIRLIAIWILLWHA